MAFKFPVFLLAKDCGEVEIYNTLESLEKELEPIDVENGEYEVWDAQGLRLKLSVQKPTWIKIEEMHPDYEGLKTVVLNYAATSGLMIGEGESESIESLKKIIQTASAQKTRSSHFSKLLDKIRSWFSDL